MKSKIWKWLALPAGVGAIALSVVLFNFGFSWLSEVRQLDRLPLSPVSIVSSGPFAVSGTTQAMGQLLNAPYSSDQVVYYRYLLEEEYRDSEGKTKTRTIDKGEQISKFILTDHTGQLQIDPTMGGDINWAVSRTYNEKRGNRIYSEWTLSLNQQIELLGHYDPRIRTMVFYDMPYNLPVIVTSEKLKQSGGNVLLKSGLLISLATGLIAIGIALILTGLKIHRYWIYVVTLLTGVLTLLWSLGFSHLQKDWKSAALLYQNRLTQHQAIPLARTDMYKMYLLVKSGASDWPDRPLFSALSNQYFPIPEGLTKAESSKVEAETQAIKSSRFEKLWIIWILVGLGSVFGFVSVRYGLKYILFKRKVEAIPTSKSRGITYGITELFGMINIDNELPAVKTKFKQKKCVAYEYHVKERRGHGKKAKWITIDEGGEWPAFWLEDDEGRVPVYGSDAVIRFPETKSWSEHGKHYTERWLPPFKNIYCLGYAGIDPQNASRLAIQAREDDLTLITTQEENAVIQGEGAKGFLLTGIGLALSLVVGTSLLAGSGQLTPADLILVSAIVPVFLLLLTVIIHYNDLVFLRNRVLKIRSDVDTLLQRRYNLWPGLLNSVKGYLSHESKLFSAITRLRKIPTAPTDLPDKIDSRLEFEKKVVSTLNVRIEAYPELKSNEVIQKFQTQMKETEEQLALVRSGLIDCIELYHTRSQSFPDVIIARLFGFKKMSQYSRSK